MPPTLTSAGLETPQQTLERSRVMLANSQTPKTVASTGIKVEIPSTIPSTDLKGDTTMGDVMARRAELETIQNQNAQFDTDYQNLTGRIKAPFTASPLSNPEEYINRFLLNEPTDTQNRMDELGRQQAEQTRQYAQEYDQLGDTAREQFNLPGLEEERAQTRMRKAEITKRLRETLRDFETNAERRGVAREFVDSEKQKVLSDATAELADLAIIEAAQTGNIQDANDQIDDLLAEKEKVYNAENAAIAQEIAALEKKDTREATQRAGMLNIALAERTTMMQKALDDERETRGYVVQAAANGADQGTLDAIRNAQSPQEAAFLAGPWVGRLERMQANASIRSANASAALNEYELLAVQEQKKQTEDAIASGQLLPDQAEVADSIDKDFRSEPVVKEYNVAVAKRAPALEVITNGVNGVQDLLLVYEFMKAVDPTSVVRESEFDNAAKSGNIFAGQWTKFNNGYFGQGGFLPPNVKTSFLGALNASWNIRQNQYYNVKNEFGEKISRRIGVEDGASYLTDYEAAAPIENVLPVNDESDDPLGLFIQNPVSTPPMSMTEQLIRGY